MLNSKGSLYRSGRKGEKGSEPPTAVKSFYGEASPTPAEMGRSLRSPTRYGSQIDDTRHSINQLIDEVSEKRYASSFGVQKVHDVNLEALNEINENKMPHLFTPKHQMGKDYRKDYRTEGLRSTSPSYKHIQSPSDFELRPQNNSERSPDAQLENIELKKRLNYQIQYNNQMIKDINMLRSENQSLKLGSPSGKPYDDRISQDVYRELYELKKENQKLRQDTVRLLRKNTSY